MELVLSRSPGVSPIVTGTITGDLTGVTHKGFTTFGATWSADFGTDLRKSLEVFFPNNGEVDRWLLIKSGDQTCLMHQREDEAECLLRVVSGGRNVFSSVGSGSEGVVGRSISFDSGNGSLVTESNTTLYNSGGRYIHRSSPLPSWNLLGGGRYLLEFMIAVRPPYDKERFDVYFAEGGATQLKISYRYNQFVFEAPWLGTITQPWSESGAVLYQILFDKGVMLVYLNGYLQNQITYAIRDLTPNLIKNFDIGSNAHGGVDFSHCILLKGAFKFQPGLAFYGAS